MKGIKCLRLVPSFNENDLIGVWIFQISKTNNHRNMCK